MPMPETSWVLVVVSFSYSLVVVVVVVARDVAVDVVNADIVAVRILFSVRTRYMSWALLDGLST